MLTESFYLRDDVVTISRELLGKVLCSHIDGKASKMLITETEAYAGIDDKASHAYGDRRTKRTEPMYARGGVSYVYLCYGIHHLFNVVTNTDGTPHAVLIRAGRPVAGTSHMLERRGKSMVDSKLLGGPGSVAKAMGITTAQTGISLQGPAIWIEEPDQKIDTRSIVTGPRVGVDYAKEDAARPYRFILK